jgi:hypothetical protein
MTTLVSSGGWGDGSVNPGGINMFFFFFFFLNPNLYSAARTTQHRGGHVCKDIL